MQVTVTFRCRSTPKAVAKQRELDSITRGSCRLSGPLEPALIGSDVPASCDDETSKIIPAINAMSNYFDPSKKLPEPAGGSSSLPVATSPEDLDKAFQLQQIPVEEVQVHPGCRIVMHTDPRSAGADRFRFLRMSLREIWNTGKLKSLLITSPLPRDGKSTIALNLATALAEGGKRTVLLMEADLHNPTVTQQLGLECRRGLADCLEGSVEPVSVVRRLEPLNWYLLSAGEPRSNPTELLQTEAYAGVLEKLSPHFDWILIDAPPVTPLTDALSLARQANATLLVAREGRTPRELIEKAIAVLGRQRVLGIVLNGIEGLDRLYSGYYGYSGYAGNQGLKAIEGGK